ncbi:MAG: DUF616 domain-containing protein [Clostridiales bacterium]|nr:DUF616 domain-containing protein [Clostridiales bacterium]
MEKIIIFSAGENTEKFLKANKNIDIIAIADNDKSKWGISFLNFNISAPADIADMEYDYIVITTIYEKAVRQQLLNDLHIPKEKILSWEQWKQKKYVDEKYKARYTGIKKGRYDISGKRMVIYTGIFGDYDTLKEPLVKEDNVTYVCFTDQRKLQSNVWEIRYIDRYEEMPQRKVRYYKCNPHKFFEQYDISVWVDANMQIKKPIRDFVVKYMGSTGILLMPHTERDCIYEEAAANIMLKKASNIEIIKQVSRYLEEGYPEENGLYLGGFIVREHNRKEIKDCMEDWYREICTHSYRDQISLPYVFWKHQIQPDLANEVPYNTQWVKYYGHLV